MPKRRVPKTVAHKDVEKFANQCDDTVDHQSSLDPDADPVIGINVRFNKYEHKQLKMIAKKEGRSMQKQIKMIIRNHLGV